MAHAGRTRSIACLDGAAVAVLAVLSAFVVARADALPPPAWIPALVAALVVGVVVADLVTGIVHWFCDSFFEEDTPVIGRVLIHPFREHHRDPLAMTRHGFLEVSGNNALVLLPVLGGLALMAPAFGRSLAPTLLVAAGGSFAATIFMSNWIHRWAHQREVPRGVAVLQRAGWLLAPRAHKLHHRHHDRAFCVATGWCNAWLDRSGILARIERAVHARSATRGSGRA